MNRKTVFIILISALLLVAVLAACQGVAQAAKGPFSVKLQNTIDTSAQQLINVVGLAVDGDGNVYLSGAALGPGAPRVLKYDKHGRFVLQWGSEGSGPGQFSFWPPIGSDLPNGGFITVDQQGNVYVSDAYNCRVQKFDPNGDFLMQFGEQGDGNGQFQPPLGPLYVDSQDNIYVSYFPGVQKFDAQGNFLASYGSAGTGEGQFNGAAIGAIDSQGNMYIADLLNARIQKLDANGNFVLAWGSAGEGEGQFYMPVGIALSKDNLLYISDNTSHIQVFDTNGKYIAQWSEPGSDYPPFITAGAAVDRKGYVYVEGNDTTHTIYIFRPKP